MLTQTRRSVLQKPATSEVSASETGAPTSQDVSETVFFSGQCLRYDLKSHELPGNLTGKNEPRCVCLKQIGDNGYCPVHGLPVRQYVQNLVRGM